MVYVFNCSEQVSDTHTLHRWTYRLTQLRLVIEKKQTINLFSCHTYGEYHPISFDVRWITNPAETFTKDCHKLEPGAALTNSTGNALQDPQK